MIVDLLRKLTALDKDHFKIGHNDQIYFEAPRIQYEIVKDSEGNVDEFMLGAVAMWCFLILKKRYRGNRDGTTPMSEVLTMTMLFQTSVSGLTPEKILETYAAWLEATCKKS